MRTPEQQAADEALNAALEKTIEAYFPLEAGEMRMVGEFVTVVAVTEISGEEPSEGTLEIFRDGSIASWKAMGLLRTSVARLGGSYA